MPKTILYIGNDLSKSKNNPSTLQLLSKLLEKENFTVKKASCKKNKLSRLLDMVLAVIKNRKSIDYILIDTYSTSNYYYAFITSQLSRIFKIKYIPILHGGNLEKRLKNSFFLSNLIFKHSFINVAPSEFLSAIFKNYGFRILVIPNVININEYHFRERKELKPKLLYVRAFAEIYNPKMAVKVLNEVKKQFPDAKLCMIGPEKDESLKEVKKLISDLDLKDSIEIAGKLSKREWHKRSEEFDIFINTTNIDNTPVSVIEAMALGLPVVSTNVGGVPYLIKDKVDGILIEKNNASQMAQAIIELLNDNHQQIVLNARKKTESYAWEHVRHKWINLLG